MNTTPVLFLMMGLLFGTTFLTLGIAIGYWMSRKAAGYAPESAEPVAPRSAPTVEDTQQIMNVLRSFATWTSDFAGDFSQYKSTLDLLTRRAEDSDTIRTREQVQELLHQIVAANHDLQSRLESAEQKLETQTQQLAGYLSEARTDALTGLANRRAFDQRIDECFAKWTQAKTLFSLALIDIDHFKKINDAFGHPVGDSVLREVANRMREFTSEVIQIARYGGEEFAVLVKGDLSETAAIVERMRKGMCASPVIADGHSVPVTLSSGVAQICPEDRIGKLVRRSDEALYTAKLSGRNRVFIHNGVLSEMFGGADLEPPKQSLLNTVLAEPTHAQSDPLEDRILKQIDQILEKQSKL